METCNTLRNSVQSENGNNVENKTVSSIVSQNHQPIPTLTSSILLWAASYSLNVSYSTKYGKTYLNVQLYLKEPDSDSLYCYYELCTHATEQFLPSFSHFRLNDEQKLRPFYPNGNKYECILPELSLVSNTAPRITPQDIVKQKLTDYCQLICFEDNYDCVVNTASCYESQPGAQLHLMLCICNKDINGNYQIISKPFFTTHAALCAPSN